MTTNNVSVSAVGARYPTVGFPISGKGTSSLGQPPQPYETFSYDAALYDTKIADFNIVPYSSVLPKDLSMIDIEQAAPYFFHGAVLEVIYAMVGATYSEGTGKTNVRFRHHGYEKAMETTDAVKAAGACIGMELGVLDDQGNVVGGYVAEYVGIYPDNPGVDTAQGYANTALNQSLDHILSLRGFKSSGKRHIVDMSYVDLDAGDNKNGSVISGLGFMNFANAPAYPQK